MYWNAETASGESDAPNGEGNGTAVFGKVLVVSSQALGPVNISTLGESLGRPPQSHAYLRVAARRRETPKRLVLFESLRSMAGACPLNCFTRRRSQVRVQLSRSRGGRLTSTCTSFRAGRVSRQRSAAQ